MGTAQLTGTSTNDDALDGGAPRRELMLEYGEALERFLRSEDESALEDAYELGRRTMEREIGVVHLAWVHHDALASILPTFPLERRGASAVQAARFFAECLAPIEMLQRGVRESLERTHGLNRELQRRADEITAAKETIERLARQRSVFLAQVSLKLSMSLDLGRTLRRIPRLAVPRLADWAALDAAESGEETAKWVRRVATASPATSSKRELERLGADALSSRVRKTGEQASLTLTSAESIRRWGATPEQANLLWRTGMNQVLTLPLFDRHRVVGVLTLARSSERSFTEADREDVEEFTRRAANALMNARLHHQTQEAVHLRDDFLSIASHELRTPLTPLLLSLQQLLNSPSITLEDERLVNRAISQVHRFTSLVNDLLDVARIQSGRLELTREPVALDELVRATVSLFQATSATRKITFEPLEVGPLLILGDRDRLEQVISNLIDNALKYSPGGGEILVTVRRDGDELELSVKDEGIGIPADQVELIFNRFFRARNASVRHFGGLGLGLHISDEIIRQHTGSIRVDSEVGKGSTFRVRLPSLPGRD